MDKVPVGERNFIGLGKMFFDTRDVEWNIPHLHFLVNKANPNLFESINLEFGLVSTGGTLAESIESLANQTHTYIFSVMKNAGYDQFIDVVNSNTMEDFWKQYRKIEFSLARKGNDLSHDIDKQLERAVKSIMTEKVNRALDALARNQAVELVNEVKRIVNLNEVFDFQYTAADKDAA